ncbi:NAD(P)-binding domain-containing protein [Kiloniella laminariae]|uniref:trimethylamine monooxygenase n=1 Tax=Kiloniella laminariae TaxID=454162 RepID=A0ABT4LK97_9PROT|nr:NAD(P)-binding domain-containing protein [Kiloniella laminariae]MCZ4280422.1 NAD(P)-binding domain-containing protein [Kiloniella laminariae]
MKNTNQTIAIIGAGPVGLAAAVRAMERGLVPIIFEKGSVVGQAIRQWQHVRMFSPWQYNIDSACRQLLLASGWQEPAAETFPTGGDFVAGYLAPLAELPELKKHLLFSSKVTAISRVGYDKLKTPGRNSTPFEIRYQKDAEEKVLLVDAVLDASGTWDSPNPAGANGLPAIGEKQAAARISYGMPDILGTKRNRYAGKRVAVLGMGHSATGNLIDLVALKKQVPDTSIVWLVRGEDPSRAFGGGANDQLAARGALGVEIRKLLEEGDLSLKAGFRLSHISEDNTGLQLQSEGISTSQQISVDELIVSTGFRPDFSFASEIRLLLDPALECPPALAPLIDPNEHSCGTVRPHGAAELAQPEQGFYIAGMKSYGRAPTFLTLTGYEQVRSILAEIAGDKEAAARVELRLPETGVCSSDRVTETGKASSCCGAPAISPDTATETEKASGCCGGPAIQRKDACCVKDEVAKDQGKAGCGCGTTSPQEAVA